VSGQAGEAGDYRVVGVLPKILVDRRGELVDAVAGGVQDCQQGQRLGAHRLLD
jgi:hypothetical protein